MIISLSLSIYQNIMAQTMNMYKVSLCVCLCVNPCEPMGKSEIDTGMSPMVIHFSFERGFLTEHEARLTGW